MSLTVLEIEVTRKNLIKELGLFILGSVQGLSFCPSRLLNPINRQHGIACGSGKLENEKKFAVFYDIKVMNAEVSAKKFEKCRLLTRLLGQNVENLDDYSCAKIQDLVRQGKANRKRTGKANRKSERGSALDTLSDAKQGVTVPRGKRRCVETGQCNI